MHNTNSREYPEKKENLISQLKYLSFAECEEIYNNSQNTEDINYEDVTSIKEPISKADEVNSIIYATMIDMDSFSGNPEDEDNNYAGFDGEENNYMEEN